MFIKLNGPCLAMWNVTPFTESWFIHVVHHTSAGEISRDMQQRVEMTRGEKHGNCFEKATFYNCKLRGSVHTVYAVTNILTRSWVNGL
jgi:hypothetical protein